MSATHERGLEQLSGLEPGPGGTEAPDGVGPNRFGARVAVAGSVVVLEAAWLSALGYALWRLVSLV